MPRTSSNNLLLQLVEYSPMTFRAAGKKAELVPFMLVSRTGRISFNRKAAPGNQELPDVPAYGPCG